MAVKKLSISIPEDVAEAAAAAARLEGLSLSAWFGEAAFARLGHLSRLEIGRRAARELVEESEAKNGPASAEDIAWVEATVQQILGNGHQHDGRTAG